MKIWVKTQIKTNKQSKPESWVWQLESVIPALGSQRQISCLLVTQSCWIGELQTQWETLHQKIIMVDKSTWQLLASRGREGKQPQVPSLGILYFFETESFIGPEITNQWAPEICLSLPLPQWDYNHIPCLEVLHGVWRLNPGPCACKSRALQTEPSSQPLISPPIFLCPWALQAFVSCLQWTLEGGTTFFYLPSAEAGCSSVSGGLWA